MGTGQTLLVVEVDKLVRQGLAVVLEQAATSSSLRPTAVKHSSTCATTFVLDV
jgi:hypothetical protein